MHEVAAMKQPAVGGYTGASLPSTPFPRTPGDPNQTTRNLHFSSSSHSSNARHFLGALNTRKIGARLAVKLRKSQSGGFGIKIAERANTVGAHSPIHITAILATGSAYQDGRLKEGDMLLEINGQQLAGLTQLEVTRLLKSLAPNSLVEFVVSRPAAKDKTTTTTTTESSVDSLPTTPKQALKVSPRETLKSQFQFPVPATNKYTQAPRSPELSQQIDNKCDTANSQSLIDLDAPDYDDLASFDDSKFEQKIDSIINKRNLDGPGTYHYDIPLNDTKSAGLGLYLKFPTVDRKDLGVWIEKVITGGAAWKDGRLLPDDQILAINGINIVGLSNAKATETLKAGCRGFYPENDSKTIRLSIHRRDPSVISRILQGVNNQRSTPDDQPDLYSTNGSTNQSSKTSVQALDKTLNNTVESYHTAFDITTQIKSHSNNNNNNNSRSSNGSSTHTSRTDSALSPRTQASNSFKLQGSHSDRTNDTSSVTSLTTDFTTLPDEQAFDANYKYSENHHHHHHHQAAYTLPKTLDTYVNINDYHHQAAPERPASTKSCDEEDIDRKPERKRFQRDGFGRQSMSEKTHAQLMARNSETFKKNQKVREERGRQKQLEDRMEKMRLSESKSHSSFKDTNDSRRSATLGRPSSKMINSYTTNDMIHIYNQEAPQVMPNYKTDNVMPQVHMMTNGHRELPVDVPMPMYHHRASSTLENNRNSCHIIQSDYYPPRPANNYDVINHNHHNHQHHTPQQQQQHHHQHQSHDPYSQNMFSCQMSNVHHMSADEACWRCRALNLRVYEVSPRTPLEQPNPFATFGRRNNSFRAAINKSHNETSLRDRFN